MPRKIEGSNMSERVTHPPTEIDTYTTGRTKLREAMALQCYVHSIVCPPTLQNSTRVESYRMEKAFSHKWTTTNENSLPSMLSLTPFL